MGKIPRIAVEPLFDQVVESCGGCRVDSIFNQELSWENADYYFPREKVVSELKEITTDINSDKDLPRRLGEIYNKYQNLPEMPLLFGTAPVRIDLLPEECRREMLVLFKRKFEGRIKKAARQIKRTKRELGEDAAKGLLILVNESSTFLSPSLTMFLLHHTLKGQNSSIDHIVYCSINMLLEVKGPYDGARFWLSSPVEGRGDVPKELLDRLSQSFREKIDNFVGIDGVVLPSGAVSVDNSVFAKTNMVGTAADFVRAGEFYEEMPGFYYYCKNIESGTAKLVLVESWQNGKLIQAEFEQKLIHATRSRYRLVEDKKIVARLLKRLSKLYN